MLQNYTYILNYQKCAFTKIVANIRISRSPNFINAFIGVLLISSLFFHIAQCSTAISHLKNFSEIC